MSVSDVWEAVVDCRQRGEPAAMCTIVSTLGSTPGKDPMKMLVRADGSFVGSVGGGCLEAEVWEHARDVMRSLRPMTCEFTLTEAHYPDSGLVCGGTVRVFIEPVTAPGLLLYGAGHVGAATARLARDAGFRVVVHDDRPDMLDAERLGEGIGSRGGEWEALVREGPPGELDFVVVVTRGHHDDERVLRALHAAGVRPRMLGMIGSRAKRAILLGRLAADGVPQDWLDRVVTPVGLPIGARTAPEIAVSIVAQLIAEVRGPAAESQDPQGASQASQTSPPGPLGAPAGRPRGGAGQPPPA